MRLLVFFLFNVSVVYSASYNDTKTLLSNLLTGYDTNIRPVDNQSEAVAVVVQLFAKSIQEFDEVKEMFSFVAGVLLIWTDINMRWNPADYGGLVQITVSYDDVWVPELVLSSPSDTIDSLGKKWNRVRYFANGLAQWLPADLIKSTCAVNVRNYPFDSQSCVTSFNALGYDYSELVISPYAPEIDLSIYQMNALWDILDTSSVASDSEGGGSQIDFTFKLKRKPSFVIINVILPILFLSLLNVLVFLLVPESGERASFSITVLLSIAVFMTIVSDMLPRSSQPVPIISYKLMFDMVISSVIVLVMVLNLRIYSRDNKEPIPKWMKVLYNVTTCQWYGRRKIDNYNNRGSLKTYIPRADDSGVKDAEGAKKLKSMKTINVRAINALETAGNEKESIERKLSSLIPLTDELLERTKITWKKISFMFDWIALIFFTSLSIASFTIFMCITALSAD